MLQYSLARRSFGAVGDEQDDATLIQVVPRRGVEPNGVADYALALARELNASSGFRSVILSASPSAHTMPRHEEWKTVFLSRREAQCIADTIQALSSKRRALAVLLHFSGYGYEKRGVPIWLAEGLRLWSRRAHRVPLLTIFHELYATGRPWQSSFWLSPLQKHVARRILNLSSSAVTPTDLYRKRLSRLRDQSGTEIISMPVFSNVGEAGLGSAPHARSATATIFGLAGVEDRLLGAYRSEIERIVLAVGLKQIVDIGPRFKPVPRMLAGVPVISKGILPEPAVSELLQQTRFGFVAYPLDFIGKSGVFAAYAAHGVVPIVLSDKQGSFDGLQPARHFLDGLRLGAAADAKELASIQCALWKWYASHCLNAQAELVANFIRSTRHC
jgi:hypothetical protein